MNRLNEKYQIDETTQTFSFKPFYSNRRHLKWYLLILLLLAVYYFLRFNYINETDIIICTTVSLVVLFYLSKEILVNIPIKYTFDKSNKTIYQSSLFKKNKKIMSFDEVIIFQNSNMGTWNYKMGIKKKQFLKNYTISENFTNKSNSENLIDYHKDILEKIIEITDKGTENNTSSRDHTFNH